MLQEFRDEYCCFLHLCVSGISLRGESIALTRGSSGTAKVGTELQSSGECLAVRLNSQPALTSTIQTGNHLCFGRLHLWP